jgi:GntR family transcriptional regulator
MNRFLSRPLYLQLRDALVERIASGQWTPGTVVPNEGDLAREFGVSQGTIRKALKLLEAMRLITRRQGHGTVVNDPSAEELAARYDNVRNADGNNIPDEVKTGEVTQQPSTELERVRLRLTGDEHVCRFHRRRVHDGRAYMVEDVSLPAILFPGLANVQGPSVSVTLLAARYGILLGKAEERVSIGEASLEVAEALEIPFGSPVLMLDRVVFALDGRAVEWRTGWCHVAGKVYLVGMQ